MFSYKINEVFENQLFEILKPDGTVYTVQQVSMSTPWTCDCPAGSHGRSCKHLQMVADYIIKGGPNG